MDDAEQTQEAGGVGLQVVLAPTLNLAFFQNAVPVLREAAIVNETDAPLEGVELRVASDPAFFSPKTWRIERVGPRQSYHLRDLDIDLDGGLLARLTEAERAQVTFTLTAPGREPVEASHSIELLARNQWGGIGQVPELLAAFVQPNDPAVDRILKKTAEVLRAAGKDPALDGYEKGSKGRAWELVSALWSAVRSLSLDYALPPASFELAGQKVRSPGQILEAGLATCLDLTLLFAACIEQLGLNPVVVITKGHSFVGCWLKPEELTTAAVDDVTALRKRISLQELVVFETTLVTGDKPAGFKHALDRGARQLSPDDEDKFELAIDIRRARRQRIRPLAAAEAVVVAGEGVAVAEASTPFEAAPALAEEEIVEVAQPAADTPAGRLDRWQRRLLDLTLRNNLLNFKAAKRAITLDAPDPGRLEDRLAEGQEMRIRPRPEIMQGADPRSAGLHEARHHEDARRQHAIDALARHEVLVGLSGEDLDARLVDLYRSARASLQEGGANTLFLALGFLRWKREAKDERSYRAPLILIPVSLLRKSIHSGFRLKLHEDEPRFNPTLLEMLRQDFKLSLPFGDNVLPKDKAGVDVQHIWRRVAEAITDIPGWEVSEEVILSSFSFAKYLMWKDLVDRTEQLKQNPVVRHLVDHPHEPFPSDVAFPRPDTLDDMDPARIFCPLPADSSQLAAVMAAASGKNFVLVGPPGTGKSQTISNIIAQCLAEGKSVLFVSEKIAALDVVYRRLKAVGLGDFCLEMHSNKAKKAEVLAQLKDAWAVRGNLDQVGWEREAACLKALRDRLNGFVRHLHRRHRNGLTARTAIARIVGASDLPEVALSWPSLDAHDEAGLDELRAMADRLQVNADKAEVAPESPLRAVLRGEWSPNWQLSLVGAAGALGAAAAEAEQAARAFGAAVGLPDAPLDGRRHRVLADLAEVLPQASGRDWRFVIRPDGRAIRERLERGLQLLEEREEKRAGLSLDYLPEALGSDIQEWRSLWTGAQGAWVLKRVLVERKVARELMRRAGGGKQKPDCARDLGLLAAIRELDREIDALADLGDKTYGLWRGLATDGTEIRAVTTFADALLRGIAALSADADDLGRVHRAVERLLGEANPLLEHTGTVSVAAGRYREIHDRLDEAIRRFGELSGTAAGDGRIGERDLPELRDLAAGISGQQERLNAWCAWRRVRDEALAVGLGELVAAIEAGTVERGRIVETFEANYCRWWIRELFDADEVLRHFVSAEHERLIGDFQALDGRLMELTSGYVRARLCAGLPDPDNLTGGLDWGASAKQWGTLKHEMQKKKNLMPLRELIGSAPQALGKLAPCLLMSPLSIAQYLPAGQAPFDVVVFDEASQIPVWDAIGAIARGRHAVIVGDPKQLPPTSFFDRAVDDGDDDVVADDDLESILDECMGANLPELLLNWHYRSRHESLITFSNHRYYGGRLITFPSPAVEDRSVRFHHVEDGIYEKGGARINQPEARALVADIMKRLTDPEFISSGLSIGVVTFNAEQQRLIEDLLDRERGRDPSIEPFFAEDNPEALLVKNLESIQGDERDVMYFSITYGPDRTGAVSMNFGPMNRDGGERRLNVAVTRARHELRIFSSLLPERIDLSRTQALGVRDLKHYLDFAMRGPRALAEATVGSVGDFESPFEQAVAAALAGRGWRVVPQIGVSAFRVDLGVVHPDKPGVYLAGIECDGATYHRSATARDRDKLREQVLRGLGWKILRIWSLDWWFDAGGTLEKIDGQLKALLEAERSVKAPEPAREAEEVSPNMFDFFEEPNDVPGELVGTVTELAIVERPVVIARHGGAGVAASGRETRIYRLADPASVTAADPERFYDAHYDDRLTEMIRHIVAVEGPIRDEMLARRIGNAHGFQRTGRRIRERVERLARRVARSTREDVGRFFWPDGSEPGQWETFRRANDGTEPRPIDDVVMPELVALAREVRSNGYEGEEALIVMARTAGLQRLRAATRPRLERAWSEALSKDH